MTGAPVDRLPPFSWMREENVARVMAVLGADAARFVGGAVRDALLGRAVIDIDIATKLPPETVVERLGEAGIATVPTGLDHGTVTALVPGRTVEITTLRRDVETDGRHARVALIDDWDEDARRRDFTINALYLDSVGNLYDPIGGRVDLRAGRIRFIGNAEARIAEDGLRLLRFYRFFALYGKGEADRDARAACRKAAPLMNHLSAERVQAELLRLLQAPNPLPALQIMAADGLLTVILPEAMRLDRLARLIAIEPEPDALRRLAAAVSVDKAGATALAKRLRLSNEMRTRLETLAAPPWPIDLGGGEKRQRGALYRLGRPLYRDLLLLSGDQTRAPRLIAQAEKLTLPVFPLKGGDVADMGVAPGPKIGRKLAEIETWWEEQDYLPDRAACLAELKTRL
ncbi:MAG TPA: CCA tRNA nucleotidyltransferase [Stellaceae bacterium]|jgi:poly(A) polymerase|nr:CCA tRNA nucleotidyltransferase [Stellaceae bacterium]